MSGRPSRKRKPHSVGWNEDHVRPTIRPNKSLKVFLMIEIEEFKDYGRFAKTTKVGVFILK